MTSTYDSDSAQGLGAQPEGFRAGFFALVGRPNAGKSTLTNALVGQKVAITSSKPQTTRHTIRGIVTRDYYQIVIVDTPGLHRPRTLLGERLNTLVHDTLAEVDVIGLCIPADQKIGPGDRHIAGDLAQLKSEKRRLKIIAVVTKIDAVSKDAVGEQLLAVQELMDFDDIVPVSSVKDLQLDVITDVIASHLPPSPQLYPADEITDEDHEKFIAELVREAALEGVRDELPHSLAVVVEEIVEDESQRDQPTKSVFGPGRLIVRVNIYVERPSQKAIVIGRGGSRLKEVGSTSRMGIQALMQRRIFLDLHVKVAKDWQRDPKQMRKLGF
ncbi:GTPase Era [Micrococcales bacterium 31B]|nr:GTPase Era [Micrococcales bacterium 31B]